MVLGDKFAKSIKRLAITAETCNVIEQPFFFFKVIKIIMVSLYTFTSKQLENQNKGIVIVQKKKRLKVLIDV